MFSLINTICKMQDQWHLYMCMIKALLHKWALYMCMKPLCIMWHFYWAYVHKTPCFVLKWLGILLNVRYAFMFTKYPSQVLGMVFKKEVPWKKKSHERHQFIHASLHLIKYIQDMILSYIWKHISQYGMLRIFLFTHRYTQTEWLKEGIL